MQRHCKRCNKRGSVIIFVSFALISIMSAAIMFTISAREISEKSFQRNILNLASRSVMSEYDLKLYEDYGLFALRASPTYIKNRLEFYINRCDAWSDDAFSLEIDSMNIDLEDFSVINTDEFENQIIEAAKYSFLKIGNQDVENVTDITSSSIVFDEGISVSNRLPSSGYKNKGIDLSLPELTEDSLKGFLEGSGNSFLTNVYIFNHYNHLRNTVSNDTVLDYEVEYIIAGKSNDSANLAKIEQYFITLRTPINIAKIYADPARAVAALAEAELLTPGPAAVATQLLIITAWAADDAADEWKSVITGIPVDGLYYKDYLSIFLLLHEREIKLLRMLDLIQINLESTYYDSFRIDEFYTGFSADVVVDGREFSYVQTY